MSISHRKAFELLQQGLDACLQNGMGVQPPEDLRAEVLATLEPRQRAELKAHWADCPECRSDLVLHADLRAAAKHSWSHRSAPQRSTSEMIHNVRQIRSKVELREQALAPLRLSLLAVALVATVLVLQWLFSTLRPQPAVLPLVSTPSSSNTRTPQAGETPQPTQVATESLPVSVTMLAPLQPAGLNNPGRWSPDGRYLFFTQVEPSSDPGSDRVYTSFNFIDTQSSEVCQVGESLLGSMEANGRSAWLPDGRLLFATFREVYLLTPCGPLIEDITALFGEPIRVSMHRKPPGDYLVLTGSSAYWVYDVAQTTAFLLSEPTPSASGYGNIAWSPSGEAVVISQPAEGPGASGALISLVDVRNGQLIDTFPVPYGPQGYAPWVDWVMDDLLLVYDPDNGGQLVEFQTGAAPKFTRVLDEIFGLDLQPPAQIIAESSVGDPQSGSYHLALTIHAPEASAIYLYHSEDGRLETLPHDYDTLLFYPNSEQMEAMMRWQTQPASPDEFELVWVDQPEAPLHHLVVAGHTPRQYPTLYPEWFPDSQRLAFASNQGVSLLSTQDGSLIGFWKLEGSENSPYVGLLKAPGDQALIANALVDSGGMGPPQSVFYVIPLPP